MGASDPASTAPHATASAAPITRVRPTRSAKADTGSTAIATVPVVTATVRLAAVAPTPKAPPMSGRSACVA